MALPETAHQAAPPGEATLDEQATGASGMRLKVATRPAAVGTTWLDLFHPGSPSELTLEARVRVIADVTGALIQIHENSGIPRQHRRHGRLTPRHVLVTVDGSACLFHVKEPFSRLLPPQPDLGYLAPELLTQSASANQQCDIFSLGVLLWEALDNGRLFPHRRAAAISRLSSRSLPSPRASEEWALPLCDVALRALAHDPAERYADATAFWLALREHLPSPDGARAALARLVQRELKLELTSEIRDVPPYLTRGLAPIGSRPPDALDLAGLEPDSARYSMRPEPSSRRLSGGVPPSILPDTQNPAWLLSDPPPTSSRPRSAVVERVSVVPETKLSEKPPESQLSERAPVSRGPEGLERGGASRAPAAEPALSALRVSLQRDLADGSMPFFVGSQPTARPFPWGALSFAALIFFGVGAAVAFGAVSALRASRDVVVRERTVLEAPTPAVSPAEVRPVPPAPAPVPEPPVVAAPAAPVLAQPSAVVAPSKAVEARTEPARRAARRAPKAAKPRPMPVRPASSERTKEATPGKEAGPTKEDALPFTSQPY
jgi:hypothetical protein